MAITASGITDFLLSLLPAALAGGTLCLIAQLLIDLTKLTPARIMVLYTVLGVLLYSVGLFEPLKEAFGQGVTLPILGFGATLAKGVREAVDAQGLLGVISGGLANSAPGITATLLLGVLLSFIVKGRPKRP